MKKKEEALRWLKQGEYNLRVAESNLKEGFYSASCFMSEQSAQMALKAYLIYKTGRYTILHSIKRLAEECLKYEKEFNKMIEYGKILDRYYIPTRYPDALAPPAIPAEIYTEKDATEALNFAKEILELVSQKIKEEK
ncbi:MAG: HEPN domain-containing protein [Candidatus Hydrothermales bacterium]